MRIDILTLFPEMVSAAFRESILARAITAGYLEIECHQIRDYTQDKQGKVDDYPYGGGPGLVMAYQPIKSCWDAVCESARKMSSNGARPYTVYMSPQGTPLTERVARRLSKEDHLVILCGHYEGVDERIITDIVDEEISIGDYVLTGGEIPAMALMDSVARLVPGVLASDESSLNESHTDLLLEYPQYTHPAEINGMKVPDILFGGNHADIEAWRLKEAISRTQTKRPDLYDLYEARERAKNTYYFDNSATTFMVPETIKAYTEAANKVPGNPSSLHSVGFDAEKSLRKSRKNIASAIGADMNEIYFTACATESNNWVMRGITLGNPRLGKHVLVSAVEHPSVMESAMSLKDLGYDVEIIPVEPNGSVSPDTVEKMVRPDTAIVSVMHVNSETGAINPISEISARVRKVNPNTLIHTDAVQSFCKIPTDVHTLGVDMMSVSAHKIHGPKGVGFLYIRRGIKIKPLMYGGGQELGLRSGTENVQGIAAMAASVELLMPKLSENSTRVMAMRQKFIDATSKIRNAVVTSQIESGSPYILNIAFPGLNAEVILHSLEKFGVYVSVGSACSSHKKGRSPVLTAMGYKNIVIDGAIRISFSSFNTEEQAEYASKVLAREVLKLYAETGRNKNETRDFSKNR